MVSPLLKIGLGLAAAGQVVQGLQSLAAGQEAEEIAKAEALSVRRTAEINDRLRRIQTRKIIGRQIAEAGRGGSFSESDQAVIAQSIIEDELESDIKFFNSEVQATQILNQGRISARRGQFGFTSSLFGAGAFTSKFLDIRK